MDFLYQSKKDSLSDSISDEIVLEGDAAILNEKSQNSWEKRERGEIDNEQLQEEVKGILDAYTNSDAKTKQKNRPTGR